jgi:DNA polymerase I-like protein with 3'-5' exonuclease and polymerase domains
MVLQIHDELVFDVQGKTGPIKELKKVIIACMEEEVRRSASEQPVSSQ